MKKDKKLYCLFYIISPYDGSLFLGTYSSLENLQEAKKEYIKKYHTENGQTYGASDDHFNTFEVILDAPANHRTPL